MEIPKEGLSLENKWWRRRESNLTPLYPQQYNDLFKDWEGIVEDINIDEIMPGDPIPNTAILFRY